MAPKKPKPEQPRRFNPAAETFVREVDEEMHHERLVKLWQVYGKYVISIAAGVVLGTIILVSWQSYKTARQEKASIQFTQAMGMLSDQKADEALSILQGLSQNGPSAYRAMSLLQQANIYRNQGNREATIQAYIQLMDDRGVDRTYRDLTAILMGYYVVGTDDFSQVADQIDSLGQKKNPWQYSALEIKALEAVSQHKVSNATGYLDQIIAAKKAPPSLKKRAVSLKEVIR